MVMVLLLLLSGLLLLLPPGTTTAATAAAAAAAAAVNTAVRTGADMPKCYGVTVFTCYLPALTPPCQGDKLTPIRRGE